MQSYFYFSDAEQISVLGDEDNAGISGGNDGKVAGIDSDDNPDDYGDDGDDDKDGDDADGDYMVMRKMMMIVAMFTMVVVRMGPVVRSEVGSVVRPRLVLGVGPG